MQHSNICGTNKNNDELNHKIIVVGGAVIYENDILCMLTEDPIQENGLFRLIIYFIFRIHLFFSRLFFASFYLNN